MKKSIIILAVITAMAISACGQGNTVSGTTTEASTEAAKEVNLDELHEAVKAVYGDEYIPNMEYDDQMLSDVFGVNSDLYDSYIAEGPAISVNVETFIAIKAKEGKGEDVEKALTAYREKLVADTMQYPMNIVKIQSSQVIRHGDYVFFVMLGSPSMEAEEKGDEAALKSAEENNKKAIDIINSFFGA